jgi:hypothetical protein
MSISRKRIKQIVRECIDETTSAVVEEEAGAIAELAAEKLVQSLDEAYDDDEDVEAALAESEDLDG